MAIIWFIHICILVCFLWLFFKKYRKSHIGAYFWYGIFLKMAAGIAFGCYYKFISQGGDSWTYFENAKILSDWALVDPTGYLQVLLFGAVPESLSTYLAYLEQPRAFLMVRLLSVFTLLCGKNYWLISLYFSAFAFIGIWSLVAHIVSSYPESKKAALAAFVFLPSALFWGSGISKEAVFLGGAGFLVSWTWPYFKVEGKQRIFKWILAVAIGVLLFQLKYYYMAILIPVLVASIIHYHLLSKHNHWQLDQLSWLLTFLVVCIAASWLHPNLRLEGLANLIKSNGELLASRTGSQTLVTFKSYQDPMVWVVLNYPWALITGLFRPNLGDWGNFYQNLAVAEHLIISVFFIGTLASASGWRLKQVDWLPWLVYLVLLAGMLSLSTPNFGTLVRYKVSYWPVFVFFILYQNKWWQRLVAGLP